MKSQLQGNVALGLLMALGLATSLVGCNEYEHRDQGPVIIEQRPVYQEERPVVIEQRPEEHQDNERHDEDRGGDRH